MKIVFWALMLATILVAGCGTTPSSRLYTLGADAGESDGVAAEKRRIEIVAVRIPELWDRPQLVLTKSANEVSVSEFHRWAAPLRSEIPRVVARNLSRILDNQTIWLREDFAGAKPELRVQVMIERIDAVAGESVQLDAAWTIRRAGSDTATVGRAAIVESTAGTSHEAVVTALRRALLRMSTALAKDIAAMPKGADGR